MDYLITFLIFLWWMKQARGSCASFVFGFVTFMSIGGFPSFVEDMKVKFSLLFRLYIWMNHGKTWLKFEVCCVGFSKGEVEWALWCHCICHKQHSLSNAISDNDNIHRGKHLLFHGWSSPRFPTLLVLRIVPICECHCGRELDDGHRKCRP